MIKRMNKRDFLIAVNKLRVIKQRMDLGWNVDEDLQELIDYLAIFDFELVSDDKYVYRIIPKFKLPHEDFKSN